MRLKPVRALTPPFQACFINVTFIVAMRLKPVRALTLFVMDVDCITLIYSSNEVKSREGIDTRI